jgi:hypothetical protein
MNKQKRAVVQQWILVFVLVSVLGLVGCQQTPEPIPTATPAPETSTPISSPPPAPVTDPGGEITLSAGKTIAVHAEAEGAEGYRWEKEGVGEISSAEGDTVLYTAPAQAEGGAMALLKVVAYSASGESPQTSLVINITSAEVVSISLDALAIPAGWMSGGDNPADFISLTASSSNCNTGADCLQVTYIAGKVWGGIYWWPPACGESGTAEAWDNVRRGTCGVNMLEAYNLSSVTRLSFWARGDQGSEVIEFKIGGADVEPMPGRATGKVTLEREWKQYEISLENMDLTNAVGLFLWVAADASNPNGAVFYLDDIQFEGMKK